MRTSAIPARHLRSALVGAGLAGAYVGAAKLGLNLDVAMTDWGTMLQRRNNRGPVAQGGWSVFCTAFSSVDVATPIGHLPLHVRVWTCSGCGEVHDRDINAARNILAAGLAVTACGDGVRPIRR